MQTIKELTPEMEMAQIMDIYPGAKRAMFQKYHIGGCSSCGFAPTDTLEQVMINHNRGGQTQEAIEWIYESAKVDEEMQIEPAELKGQLDNGTEWKIFDIREDYEIETAKLENSEVLTQEIAYEMMQKWPKDTNIVFYCHTGIRSLEAASYFKGHGLPNVKSLKGGIDRWSQEIDSSIPRY